MRSVRVTMRVESGSGVGVSGRDARTHGKVEAIIARGSGFFEFPVASIDGSRCSSVVFFKSIVFEVFDDYFEYGDEMWCETS